MWSNLLELFYPRKCLACHGPLNGKEGDGLCADCRTKLQPITEPRCKRCSKPLGEMEKEFCTDCSSGNFYVERGLARYPYESVMRQTIKNFKYGGELACGDYFAEEMADQCGRWIRSVAPDVLIPVPIHEKRMRFRGFNQAEYMAERIGKRLDIEVRTDYLLRIGETKPQKDLDSVSRKKNLQKGFCVNDTSVCYQRVLLFDDIYTTGATLEACGKALKNAGTDRIYFLCLCIGNADS